MFERNLMLTYLPVRNNFLYVNKNLNFLKPGTCVRLIDYDNRIFYFSIGESSVHLEDNYIGISSLLAKALGIEDNGLFRVSEILAFSTVSSLTIVPVNQKDYEVIEILSENVQETLLNQIRVVYTSQKFIIWIGNNIFVTVYVENTNPVSPGAIDFLTEVHIEPMVVGGSTVKTALKEHTSNSFNIKNWRFLYNIEDTSTSTTNFEKYLKTSKEFIYRILPLHKLPNKNCYLHSLPDFTIFLSKTQFTEEFIEKYFSTKIFSINLLTTDVFSKEAYVTLKFLEDIEDFDLVVRNDVYVGPEIFEFFECQQGARVILKAVDKYPVVSKIQINSKKHYSTDVVQAFKKYISKGDFVLNSDTVIDIGDNVICTLNFFPDEPKFCIVDDSLVRNCKYVLNIENIAKAIKKQEEFSNVSTVKGISNYAEITRDVIRMFSTGTDLPENCIILGKPGTGKSTILKEIACELQNYPHFMHLKSVNCKSVKGKTMDSLNKFFSNAFSELLLHQPSMLVLDDLHVLCENIQGDEVAPNNIYFSRISEMLHNLLKLCTSVNKIGILASAESVDKINKNIYSSRGSHLFKNIYEIRNLGKDDRISVIKFLLQDFNLEDINCKELSIKTEGFVIQDLVHFANKTMFEVLKQESDNQQSISMKPDYIESALKNTSVISLQNVQLHAPGDKDFSNIGGLHNIKKILMENLLWPGQYPNIFEKAPLRLQSGLLLYGPPGCGKTAIAASAARQCGLRLISVKGPELLSKYIGASEQAVRDIFQKAQSAKPCILFFDEFDSLAPKRGHDNTGVTDRVVNQLLTQLDGVESLTGVCVLAATSRPDLLDSALLRPGRLDKQLLCPLPDEGERLEILKILSKNLNLDCYVSLEKVAAKIKHYSGADIQSLLYTSHMLTIDYSVESDEFLTQDSKITQSHLDEAIRKTKPSLSDKERLKYHIIYSKFQKGSTLEDFQTGSRATLA